MIYMKKSNPTDMEFLNSFFNPNINTLLASNSRSKWSEPSSKRHCPLHIVRNSDKSIRWLIPTHCKKPYFLYFYNAKTLISKLYCITFKILYFTRTKYCFLESTTYFDQRLFNNYIPENIIFDYITLFTGTAGANRKIILCLIKNDYPQFFIKIAATLSSIKLIKNEEYILKLLSQCRFYSFEHPHVFESKRNNAIVTSYIGTNRKSKDSSYGPLHTKTLIELAKKHSKRQHLVNIDIYKEIQGNLFDLKTTTFIQNGLNICAVRNSVSKIEKILSSISPSEQLTTTLSHGDFTPWNMTIGENKLYIYDWEFARENVPILFDFFHYIYQNAILSKRVDIDSIINELNVKFKSFEMQQLAKDFNANYTLEHALYLCHISSFYLPLYAKQYPLHKQANWLAETWDLALSRVLATWRVNSVTPFG